MEPEIVAADAADTERPHDILVHAKAHRGYELMWVREWAGSYDFARLFTTHLVFVAKVDREVVAWAALIPPGATGVTVLDDLWVEPA
jgi:hypothetical protein